MGNTQFVQQSPGAMLGSIIAVMNTESQTSSFAALDAPEIGQVRALSEVIFRLLMEADNGVFKAVSLLLFI